jgi:hypothetical protein
MQRVCVVGVDPNIALLMLLVALVALVATALVMVLLVLWSSCDCGCNG